ncbi:hybrid sensor histidine kinase/response regulator [Acanthopleuribacter pedis]|uniref:histidine kinase n=1 Tax=Acanthopleuribacter pedis TaxID=442870 RepID=A0A8J7U3W3_9BACT|nr:chemotaxis protein CheW [Acanthopleuribacter pedis]MBO1317691.1 chemotaxis protein CheW [Acanthopleuribacter pedis]
MSGADDEILELFLVESREHLEDIESDLLAIEEQGAATDAELVNHVFRAIHTIKGAAGFFGLHKIKELSHVMEHLLDLLRKRQLVATPKVISVLLDGADVLRGMINNPDTSNDQEITDLVESIKVCAGGEDEKAQEELNRAVDIKTNDGRVLMQVPFSDFEKAVRDSKGGDHVYLVQYDLFEIEKQNKNALEIINELQDLAYFIDSVLDVEGVGTLADEGDPKLHFYVLLATVMEHDLISHFLELSEKCVFELGEEALGFNIHSVLKKKAAPAPAAPAPEPAPTPQVTAPVEAPANPAASVVPTPPKQAAPAKLEKPAPASTPVPEPAADAAPPKPKRSGKVESYIRVNVLLLDRLMNLAGELVLTRNEMLLNANSRDWELVDRTAQKVNIITSELQEAIMSTRMQAVGVVFNKFHRIVRDLSRSLGKKIRLTVEGEHVELDKTIIEAIGDPMTHLIRNACDHGIEGPEKRIKHGKDETGTLRLSALHEAGLVVIEIADDGGGIPPDAIRDKALRMGLHTMAELEAMSDKEAVKLIFAPGFSTAAQVTDVSGRGVGMDVVHTNLSKLGGTIDIDSAVGRGTTFRIKLPLTLAIIPSLLVSVEGQQFCIPQVNLQELVRIPQSEVKNRIERIGESAVIRLREELLPLVRMRDVLGLDGTFIHPQTGEIRSDRRQNLADRRGSGASETPDDIATPRSKRDRRSDPEGAHNIAVVTANAIRYGLIVDHLMDSAEIVVKPLGRHLKDVPIYAGATILGTGSVAMILDVEGICSHMNLREIPSRREQRRDAVADAAATDVQTFLMISYGGEDLYGIPMELVQRIETADVANVEYTGGRTALKIHGRSLALFSLAEPENRQPRIKTDQFRVIIFRIAGREVGLVVDEIIDIVQQEVEIDPVTHKQIGIFGSAVINDRITLIVDLHGLVRTQVPEWVNEYEKNFTLKEAESKKTALIVEDSPFFMDQVKRYVTEAGYQTITATDGQVALNLLQERGDSVDIVLTDIEMPNMDGFELAEAIRRDPKLSHLPIIAITSIATSTAVAHSKTVGIDDYLIKLDRELIIKRAHHFIENGRAVGA